MYKGVTWCKFLVSDSSTKPISKQFQSDLERSGWQYEHQRLDFYEVMSRRMEDVSTEFFVWLNDDDFLFEESLRKCMTEIDAVAGISAIQGTFERFSERKGRLIANAYADDMRWRMSKPQVIVDGDFDSLVLAIRKEFSPFVSYSHAILRKEVLVIALRIIRNHPALSPIRFFDKIINLVAVVAGRVVMAPVLFGIRSDDRLINGIHYPTELKREVSFREFGMRQRQSGSPLSRYLGERWLGRPLTASELTRLDSVLDTVAQNVGTGGTSRTKPNWALTLRGSLAKPWTRHISRLRFKAAHGTREDWDTCEDFLQLVRRPHAHGEQGF